MNKQNQLLQTNCYDYDNDTDYYFSQSKTKAIDVKTIAALVEENILKGKRSEELKCKIERKEATKEEIIEVVTEILKSLYNMPLKFTTLYCGVYRKALHAIFENYPEYYIKELLDEYENKQLSELFALAVENVRRGREGTRGVRNMVKALKDLGELMQISQQGTMIEAQQPQGQVINIRQYFGRKDEAENLED